MSSPPPRPLGSRGRLVAAVTVLAMAVALPTAMADPVAPDGLAGPHGTDPVPAGTPSQGEHGDHFGEDLHAHGATEGDPFVLEVSADGAATLDADVPAEPLAWEGPAPDLDQIPTEWLVPTAAEQVTPSTPEELMSADTGYLAQFGPSGKGAKTDADNAAAAAVPAPPTKALPPTLDAAPGWQYTYSCDPNNKPGMIKFAQLVSAHYERPGYFTWRHCIAGDNSQHYEGRAFDWGMMADDPEDKAIGDAVAQWITANNGEMARRFGIMSIIWNRKSWYLYSPGSWRDYTGPSPHTDHLHISFTWDGAMGRTSWWTGQPVTTVDHGTCRVYSGQYAPRYTGRRTTACPTSLPAPPSSPYPVVLPQARNNYVPIAQGYLGFTGADLDGIFGPMTLAALLDYQATKGLPVTGVLDNATWARMVSSATVERVYGADRYATAAQLAKGFATGRPVFVTSGNNFPDSLAASARAGLLGGPVLLSQKSWVPWQTRQALQELRPSHVYVVGGTGVINNDAVAAIRTVTNAPVTRIGGADRYETAGLLARQYGTAVPVVYVATAEDFPDAMAGSARAAFNGGPVLLTRPGSVPAATLSAMRDINPYRVVVLGGTGSVSDAVASQLQQLTRGRILERVAGGDRYETAAALASYYDPTTTGVVYVSTGAGFADALAGSAAAGTLGGPMLLTRTDSLPDVTRQAIARLRPQQVVVVGGTGAVSNAVLEALDTLVG